jgi:beta-galactosidase/beta-glucuronidase
MNHTHPYPEEFYHLTDQFGIVVIDQTAAIGFNKAEYFFTNYS